MGEEVVSAGFEGIPGETPITTLTVDRVANHAFIEFYVSSGSVPEHIVVGKAICAVQEGIDCIKIGNLVNMSMTWNTHEPYILRYGAHEFRVVT